jgi:hypothetical protein
VEYQEERPLLKKQPQKKRALPVRKQPQKREPKKPLQMRLHKVKLRLQRKPKKKPLPFKDFLPRLNFVMMLPRHHLGSFLCLFYPGLSQL